MQVLSKTKATVDTYTSEISFSFYFSLTLSLSLPDAVESKGGMN